MRSALCHLPVLRCHVMQCLQLCSAVLCHAVRCYAASVFLSVQSPAAGACLMLALLLQVFCYNGVAAHEEMRQACFEYLKLGGIYSSGPISLLSGLAPKPSLLVMHFFMVALYGVGRLMQPRPTFR